MSESFEKLNEFEYKELKQFVPESLLLEKDDEDGILGSIIDRGLSFVPRAIRFKKAKKVMKKALEGFNVKAKKLIDKFASGFGSKVDKVVKEYERLKKEKVDPLLKDGKDEEAAEIIDSQRKELEEWKKNQIATLDKGIEDVLQAYTNSIENRIEKPGFVLNVELSEKGKGELRAKWQELAATQKMKVDEYKTNLISSKGWKKVDSILAEMNSFVKARKHGEGEIDIFVQDIVPTRAGYRVKVHIRTYGKRFNLKEKGIVIGTDPSKMELGPNTRAQKEVGTYQYNIRPYEILVQNVSKDKETFVRPYMIIRERKEPVYGDIASLDVREKSKEEMKRGEEFIRGTSSQIEPGAEEREFKNP